MAQKGVELDQEALFCSICLDLLTDPATIPCGHSYCKSCIEVFWDAEDRKQLHSCPQCRQTFAPRPNLVKNFTLAALVEQLKEPGPGAAPAEACDAGPEGVACDVCTGRKMKAVRFCLVCLASYCHAHLQPHYESATFKKHKLVQPTKNLQENICPRHDRVKELYCRTDQQSICYLCSVEEHKGHDTVSAAAERSEKQRELKRTRQDVQRKIQKKVRDVKVLQEEVKVINLSADRAVEHSEKTFTELLRLMEKTRFGVKRQIRAQQKTEVDRVRGLQAALELEIAELRRTDAELEQLPLTEDHNAFLHDYCSLAALRGPADPSSTDTRPRRYFEDVTGAVSDLSDKLQGDLRKTWTNVSSGNQESEPKPKTRSEFLKHACDLTLDPNTANACVFLSKENRKATQMKKQCHANHPDRLTHGGQAVSRERLTGRGYWELEWGGYGVTVSVAYKDSSGTGGGTRRGFGRNDTSWSLYCDKKSYVFMHNDIRTPVPGPPGSRIAVYLDHRAGLLCFYTVSTTMTLLHEVQTTFSEPLYAGVWLHFNSTAEICKVRQTEDM